MKGMHRLYVRVPDAMMAALRRELEKERRYRGTRYSMNDLCVLKLGGIGVHVERGSDVMVPRVPPPPPVPLPVHPAASFPTTFRRYGEEPQPERMVQAAPNPNEQAELDALEQGALADTEAEARERFEDEGGRDGHLDD